MYNLILLIILIITTATPSYSEVNGFEETINGIPVVHVWGSDYEMGYALGYLDGDRWKYWMEEDMIPWLGTYLWETVNSQYYDYFIVPQRMEDIALGVIAGLGARPDSLLYSSLLERDFNTTDFHMNNSVVDLCAIMFKESRFACTSVTAWDNATIGDPELLGAPAMVRNYDGSFNPILIEVPTVITLEPDEGNQTVLCGWTLELDCSSGMNEFGICATRNAANYEDVTIFTPLFVPIGYATLLGLLEDDFNGSGTNDLEDLLTAITYWNRSPSRILHTAAPRTLAYLGEPAVAVEINNTEGYDFRISSDDSIFSPDHLVATNHHRNLYAPIPCWRYTLLQDSITIDPQMTLDRFWGFMEDCTGSNYTLMTLLFLPESQKLGIAFCDTLEQSWEKDPVWFDWNQLFPPQGIEEDEYEAGQIQIVLSPNPSVGSFTVEFALTVNSEVQLVLFDITGRAVEQTTMQEYGAGSNSVSFDGIAPGVYFCRINSDGCSECRSLVVIPAGL